jgi:hypothetical protein
MHEYPRGHWDRQHCLSWVQHCRAPLARTQVSQTMPFIDKVIGKWDTFVLSVELGMRPFSTFVIQKLFLLIFFIRIYLLYKGDSLWQFQIGLYYTLVSSPPPSLLSHLPAPLKAIARCFFVLFHISIWSPSTIYLYRNLLHSPSLSHKYPPPYCTYFTVLSFVINI